MLARPFPPFALLVLFTAVNLQAQVVGGALSGTVRDVTGAPMAGVSVLVDNRETGAQRKLITDSNGHYAAPSIAIGAYEVSASKDGFSTQAKTGINLTVGQSTTVDFTLPVGEVRQVVTVEEAPSPVNLSTQRTSGLVSEKQVKELPLNGRSFDGLMTLNPAVVNYTS